MKNKEIIEVNKNGHKHEWKPFAKTKNDKQRYQCKICGKTCTEFSSSLAKKYYEHNLRLINSYVEDNDSFIWDEVLNYDEYGAIEDSDEKVFYQIEKRTVSWKQFQRCIREGKFYPLVVYAVKQDNDINSSLCLYEVYFDG